MWNSLLAYTRSDTFCMKAPPSRAAYAAAMVNVVLVGALVLGAITVARRARRPWSQLAQGVVLAVALIPVYAFVEILTVYVPPIGDPLKNLLRAAGPAVIPCGLALLAVTLVWRHAIARLGAAVLLILFPFVPLTFFNAARMMIGRDPAPFRDPPPAARLAGHAPPRRVLWMVFDEWDQSVAFSRRDPGLALPEFEAFRSRALYALNAYPPAGETGRSIPALVTGRLVKKVQPVDTNTVLLTFADQSAGVSWSTQPNVFSRARAAGFNTAVAGWSLAYCRALGRDLSACHWEVLNLPSNSLGQSFPEILLNQNRNHFETQFRSLWGRSLSTTGHSRAYTAVLEQALRYIADPGLGLVMVHLPIPHPPYFYSRATRRFDLRRPFLLGALRPFREGYPDALELADRSLATVRESMQRAGAWENTTILLSSDHSHRQSQIFTGLPERDHRVPFLLKLAGQNQGLVYEGEFNTVLSSELLLAVLNGEVSTAVEAAAWLDRRRSIGRSPYDE